MTCQVGAPGTDADFYYLCLAEPVRLLVVWLAFGLLACGCAKGGKEEILALEQARGPAGKSPACTNTAVRHYGQPRLLAGISPACKST